MKYIIIAALLLSACSQNREPQAPMKTERELVIEQYAKENSMTVEAVEAQVKIEEDAAAKQQAEENRINAIRWSDKNLNWIKIGISTGKFSESISNKVYKTHDECIADVTDEANTCTPISALPASYWNAGS